MDEERMDIYIIVGVCLGAIAIICLFITCFLILRLRQGDRKLDRELVRPAKDLEFYAPAAEGKPSTTPHAEATDTLINYAYPRHADTLPQVAHYPASAPAGMDQFILSPVPRSPSPMRPARRPSSLFGRARNSFLGVFQPRQDSTNEADADAESFYAGAEQEPALSRRPSSDGRPHSTFSAYSQSSDAGGRTSPPLRHGASKLGPNRARDTTLTRQTSVSSVGSFRRSPSLLRRLLAERTGSPAPPLPPLPSSRSSSEDEAEEVSLEAPPARRASPHLSLNLTTGTGLAYDFADQQESAISVYADTPADTRRATAASGFKVRAESTATALYSASHSRSFSADERGSFVPPPVPVRAASTYTTRPDSAYTLYTVEGTPVERPDSTYTITLGAAPFSPAPRGPLPTPPLQIVPKSPLAVSIPTGVPPSRPPRSPRRHKPAPLALAPALPLDVDLRQSVSPGVLQAFAARLRPETAVLAAQPVAVPADDDDFRFTLVAGRR